METTSTLSTQDQLDSDLIYIKGEEEELDELELHPYDRSGHWYIVHTASGAENRVKKNLEELINTADRTSGIVQEVVVPLEEVVEVRRDNKKVISSRKLFPGYVFLRCDFEDKPWANIRETPGVAGFAGQANPADEPQPLSRAEVDRFLRVSGDKTALRSRPRLQYELGDPVRVKEGPFADFTGEIIEINEDHLKIKVLVNIFGRETPVELDFSQVVKM